MGCMHLILQEQFPINGKYSSEQRAVYDVVLEAHNAACNAVKIGSSCMEPQKVSETVISQGLKDLGFLTQSMDEILEKQLFREFYYHKIGHWLGLDVHDVGAYRMGEYEVPLKNGMILTVEPGIYISDRIPVPEGQPNIDEKWKGIGIRIEDDILVTNTNPEVLSIAALKEISDLEFD